MKTIVTVLLGLIAIVALLVACGGTLPTPQHVQQRAEAMRVRLNEATYSYQEVRQYVPAVQSYLAASGRDGKYLTDLSRAIDDGIGIAQTAVDLYSRTGHAYESATDAVYWLEAAVGSLEALVGEVRDAMDAASKAGGGVGDRGGGAVDSARTAEGASTVDPVGPAPATTPREDEAP